MGNRHIYVRASVCCTCGFVGSDLGEDCGRYGSANVSITTGPSAGQITEGQCGRCDGIAGVDTLGVMEFDTSIDEFIATHVMPDGTGGDPFGSPDGRHVVLVGRNGGQVVRFLKAGEPGKPSTVAFDLELGFSTFEEETSAVFSDFSFVQTSASDGMSDGIDRDIIIIASGTENKVALVDISSGSPVTDIIALRGDGYMTARRNRRQVEWVVGTPYVWIDGTGAEDVYVLDVDKKEMVRTITGVTTTKMLSVENYAAKRTAELISQQITAAIADIPEPTQPQTQTETETQTQTQTQSTTNDNTDAQTTTLTTDNTDVQQQVLGVSSGPEYEDDSDIDPVGIAAIVVGLCALIVGIANMVYMSRSKSSDEGGNDGADSVDVKTLGSKNVA